MQKRKRNLEVSVDSALALMQEIYIELCEQRELAIRLSKKMESFMKDVEDLTTVGPIIKDQQRVLNDVAEKKLTLSKIQSALIQKDKGQITDPKKVTLSNTDRELLEQMLQEKDDKNNV